MLRCIAFDETYRDCIELLYHFLRLPPQKIRQHRIISELLSDCA
jgi:hypothetical protein